MRIVVETTIPGYLAARPTRDVVQMARQQMTREWWERCRGEHELFTSQIVLDEASASDAAMAKARLELLMPLALLEVSNATLAFARKIVDTGIPPPDADHVVTATVH